MTTRKLSSISRTREAQLAYLNDQARWQQSRRNSARSDRSSAGEAPRPSLASGETSGGKELTVCDITGDWGPYQMSLCLFAAVYSAMAAFMVVWGPMYTPDMAHVCQAEPASATTANQTSASGIPADRRECFVGASAPATPLATGEALIVDDAQQLVAVKCSSFLYNELGHGLMLTNGFDLVCDRRWLRSLVYSSALAGMLISSVTLGLFSDKFGRLRCIQLGFVISCLANLVCIFARDYFLLCACVALMSFAQIGAANALCTLLMEATSPRFRYIPVFQYSAGWALGTMSVPLFNALTLNYRLLLIVLLAWQLLMLPWLHCGVFESIRWLLSEGHLNRAQIELRRACRMNNVKTDTSLAQSIARIEAQQVRKASHIIEQEKAPRRLSRALGATMDETTRELDMLSSAIRKSFFGGAAADEQDAPERRENSATTGDSDSLKSMVNGEPAPLELAPASGAHLKNPAESLSPTLQRMSFSTPPPIIIVPANEDEEPITHLSTPMQNGDSSEKRRQFSFDRKGSLTTQGLIQLAMKYSKTIEREDQGRCFIVQMLHPKLWRQTVVLLLVLALFETSYYGLIQTNKFVGDSVDVNYVSGALGDLSASFCSCFLLAFASRNCSLILFTLLTSAVCFGMALSYQLIPEQASSAQTSQLVVRRADTLANWTSPQTNRTAFVENLVDNDANLKPISTLALLEGEDLAPMGNVAVLAELLRKLFDGSREARVLSHDDLVRLRQSITFCLSIAGKFVVSSGIQVGATIAMEAYPNNLRQTASGVIVFVGRVGSILAPFLFDDAGDEKRMFKLTLCTLGSVGLLVCCLIPATIRDHKDKELCDQMNELE